MRNFKSYIVEYLPRSVSKKHFHKIIVFGENKKEVEIVVKMLYPMVLEAQYWEIGTGYVPSEILQCEGKVSYNI